MLAASILLLREQTQPPRTITPNRNSIGGGGGGSSVYFSCEPDPVRDRDRIRRTALLAERLLALQRAQERAARAMAIGMLYGATLERMAAQEAAAAALTAQAEAAEAALAAQEAAEPDWLGWAARCNGWADAERGPNDEAWERGWQAGAMAAREEQSIARADFGADTSAIVAPAPFYQQPWFKWAVLGGIGLVGIFLITRQRPRRQRAKSRKVARSR
jgi:hypothetical protein